MSLSSPSTKVAPTHPPTAAVAQKHQHGWWHRAGLSGKLLGLGALAGLLFTFFPAITAVTTVKLFGTEKTEPARELVLASLPGKLELGLFVACLVFAFLLYPAPPGAVSRNRLLAALACAGAAVLCALWVLVSAMTAEARVLAELKQAFGSLGDGITVSCSVGLGAYLTLLASLAVAAGAGLKAKEAEGF